jgi:LmbE family N-acetylglucosaminyl deacetylase
MSKSKKLDALIFIAHPDDESFLFAGTCAKFVAEKKSVGIICATRGEKGSSHLKKPLTKKQLGQVRAKELKKAAQILKIKSVEFLNYGDGKLVDCNISELVNKLKKKIDKYHPEIVLTFGEEGITGHKDHVCIGKTVLKASRTCKCKPKEIWCAELPKSIIKDFNEHQKTMRANHGHYQYTDMKGKPLNQLHKVNIKPFKNLKLKALAAHISQASIENLNKQPVNLKNFFLSAEYYKILKP